MEQELKDAIKYLATQKKIEELQRKKKKLEEELEIEKYGAPKEEVLEKLKNYFSKDWFIWFSIYQLSTEHRFRRL